MTYREEFPDFDPATMPNIPEGFVDTSWCNDACPNFCNEAISLAIFVDYLDPQKRDYPDTARFTLYRTGDGTMTEQDIVSTDDWDAILKAINDETARIGLERALILDK
jgi:hypothetical protein